MIAGILWGTSSIESYVFGEGKIELYKVNGAVIEKGIYNVDIKNFNMDLTLILL